MSEKVDLKEFAKGYAKPSSWWKSFGIVSKFLIILAIGWAIWVSYIRPHTKFAAKTQTQSITIEHGATATIVQKTEAPKRRLIPFIEVSVAQTRNARLDTAVRAGFRMEF